MVRCWPQSFLPTSVRSCLLYHPSQTKAMETGVRPSFTGEVSALALTRLDGSSFHQNSEGPSSGCSGSRIRSVNTNRTTSVLGSSLWLRKGLVHCLGLTSTGMPYREPPELIYYTDPYGSGTRGKDTPERSSVSFAFEQGCSPLPALLPKTASERPRIPPPRAGSVFPKVSTILEQTNNDQHHGWMTQRNRRR